MADLRVARPTIRAVFPQVTPIFCFKWRDTGWRSAEEG